MLDVSRVLFSASLPIRYIYNQITHDTKRTAKQQKSQDKTKTTLAKNPNRIYHSMAHWDPDVGKNKGITFHVNPDKPNRYRISQLKRINISSVN